MRLRSLSGSRIAWVSVAMAATLTACAGRSSEQTSDSTSTAPQTSAPTTTPSPAAPSSQSWTITALGAGPVRYGMTLDEAERALGAALRADSAECWYVSPPGAPSGVRMMLENGVVVRLDINERGTLTDHGAGIGMTEAEIRAAYGDSIRVMPHKYTDGHYLIHDAGGSHRVVFETDGQRVVRYRAGTAPQVDYVEGCS